MIDRGTLSPPRLCAFLLLAALSLSAQSQPKEFDAGEAHATADPDRITIQNTALTLRWSVARGIAENPELISHPNDRTIALSRDLFVLKMQNGGTLRSSEMRVKGNPSAGNFSAQDLPAEPAATRASLHSPGKQITLRLEDATGTLSVTWRAILRNGSNYIRQEFDFHASGADWPIREIQLIHFSAKNKNKDKDKDKDQNKDGEDAAHVVGTVKGSPLALGNAFFGFEHPLAECKIENMEATCAIARELPLKDGKTLTYSSVIGVVPAGQMRRGFLRYIERERPRPYQPFLTYNSWYDIGYNNPYDQSAALDVIHSFGQELVEKRSVNLNSFLFDDGWDNPHTLWSFGPGFPNGFAPLKAAAEKYGAAPGVWLSPWGGYDKAKEERLKYGRAQGLETNAGGFALSGPKYFARFRDVTLKFIHDYGINQFKIDGTGNVNSVLPGSAFDSDFQAAISLMSEWRAASPNIFINLTTGTYPSPFWLQYADSIWRGDDDHSFAGVGSWRERWITFRDGATYHGIVQKGPLFPLNSLMLHGIIYARQADHLQTDPGNDFANEVHSYFGSGTQMQEMYITHSLLSDENWNTLAEAAKWSRENADVLVDTHWIGGDPNQLEVYGWAAWSPRKGILTLRNPSDKPQSVVIDAASAFELPQDAVREFSLRVVWIQDKKSESVQLVAGQPHTFKLEPFEVLNLEAIPKQ